MSTQDASLIAELVQRSPNPQGWAEMLRVVRDAGYDIVKRDASPIPGEALGRAEKRARALLARLAPPGTVVTPQLIDDAKRQVIELVKEELVASGLAPESANALATIMAVAINIKGK